LYSQNAGQGSHGPTPAQALLRNVAHSSAVGGTFKATSDSEGNYRLTELPAGADYVVEAEAQGFEPTPIFNHL
jgi:hypothetical protein